MTKLKEITKALVTLEAVVLFETIEGINDNISSDDLPAICKAIKYKDFAANDKFTS